MTTSSLLKTPATNSAVTVGPGAVAVSSTEGFLMKRSGFCLLVSLKIRWHWIGLGERRLWAVSTARELATMRPFGSEVMCGHFMDWRRRGEPAQKMRYLMKSFLPDACSQGTSSCSEFR